MTVTDGVALALVAIFLLIALFQPLVPPETPTAPSSKRARKALEVLKEFEREQRRLRQEANIGTRRSVAFILKPGQTVNDKFYAVTGQQVRISADGPYIWRNFTDVSYTDKLEKRRVVTITFHLEGWVHILSVPGIKRDVTITIEPY